MNKPLNIAIAGLGTVGGGVVKILQNHRDLLESRAGRPINIVAVSARNKLKANSRLDLKNIKWHDSAEELAGLKDVDVVVELIGGKDGIAKNLCEAALKNGKHVITANKAMIAVHGTQLAELAEKNNVNLAFEASVAGGIPVLKGLREGMAANRITRVVGILNGTSNYILTAMHQSGRDFAGVLAEAQKLGYAETDPSFDVDGIDAAHKLTILTSIAFGTRVDFDAVSIDGIRDITAEDIRHAQTLGYVIKLLAIARRDEKGRVSQSVHPAMVPASSDIAAVNGVFNAVMIEGDPIGRVLFEGRGAGEGPTASAVVADILDIARGDRYRPFNLRSDKLEKATTAPAGEQATSFYLRINVTDKPGVLADVSQIFSKHGISVQTLVQQGHTPGEPVQLILTTHPAPAQAMEKAVSEIAGLNTVQGPVRRLRITEP